MSNTETTRTTNLSEWSTKVSVQITDTGRYKVLSPCGATGFGRTFEAAIRDCASSAGIKLT